MRKMEIYIYSNIDKIKFKIKVKITYKPLFLPEILHYIIKSPYVLFVMFFQIMILCAAVMYALRNIEISNSISKYAFYFLIIGVFIKIAHLMQYKETK